MEDRFAQLRRALEESALSGTATSDPSLRVSAFKRADLPPELVTLVGKIHDHAYKVTDEDVAPLKQKYNDHELYELILCAALGAASERLEAGLRALDAKEDEVSRAAAKG